MTELKELSGSGKVSEEEEKQELLCGKSGAVTC